MAAPPLRFGLPTVAVTADLKSTRLFAMRVTQSRATDIDAERPLA